MNPDCNCRHIASTSEEASRILEEGGIPLISLDPLQTNSGLDSRLKVVRYRSSQRYVAISHVWSDGLGNVEQNSLPLCQIKRLHDLLQELRQLEERSVDVLNGKLVFWIDALCVPLETNARKLAIQRMASTYQNATQVLVLDSELRRTSQRGKPLHEIFARIASSGWMRRVWTLQEGVFARCLFCEFSDGIMNVSQAVEWVNEESNSREVELNMVPLEFMSVIGVFLSIRRSGIEDVCKCFISTWNSINIRQTSKAGDEVVCFAHLLGLDVTDILKTNDPIMRMKTCISMLPHVPLGLLFTFGPKLEIDGYRWAPRSFFQKERIDNSSTQIARDERGLITNKLGIMLSHYFGHSFRKQSLYESTNRDEEGWVYSLQLPNDWEEDYPGILTRLADPNLRLAVIVDGLWLHASILKGGVQSALVSILDEPDDYGLLCRYECGVNLDSLRKGEMESAEIIGSGTRIDHQDWHIG